MARIDQMLHDASRKRELAKDIRRQAEVMERDGLRGVAFKKAEKLENEAAALESVARATRRGAERGR